MLRIPKFVRKSISGKITLPVSKSLANRSLVIQAIAGQALPELNENLSNDVVLLYRALSGKESVINFEDAGTPLRFYLAYAALMGNGSTWIKGSERLMERPIKDLLIALEQLGAIFEFVSVPYQLPLRITQTVDLTKDSVEINAELSSQFVSALLLIAPKFRNGLNICLTGEITSEPYIEMTIHLMQKSGINVHRTSVGFNVPNGLYKPVNMPLEGDWSSASFVYALLSQAEEADVLINNISLDSVQGDKIVAQIFESFGIHSTKEEKGIRLKKVPTIIHDFKMDFKHCPDLFPPVLAVCAACGITARFTGIESLRLKESDRVEAMKTNLGNFGYVLKIGEDFIELPASEQTLNSDIEKIIRSYNDHRITMAMTLMAYQVPILVDEPDTVRKSFPGYWQILEELFGIITEKVSE